MSPRGRKKGSTVPNFRASMPGTLNSVSTSRSCSTSSTIDSIPSSHFFPSTSDFSPSTSNSNLLSLNSTPKRTPSSLKRTYFTRKRASSTPKCIIPPWPKRSTSKTPQPSCSRSELSPSTPQPSCSTSKSTTPRTKMTLRSKSCTTPGSKPTSKATTPRTTATTPPSPERILLSAKAVARIMAAAPRSTPVTPRPPLSPRSAYIVDFSSGESSDESSEKKLKPPVPRSVKYMKLLEARELGLGFSHRFPEEVYGLKLADYHKEEENSYCFVNSDEMEHTIYFLRPGRNAVVAIWYVQNGRMFSTAAGQLHYNPTEVYPGAGGYFTCSNRMVDACQLRVNPDCFVYVTSQATRHTGEVDVAVQAVQSPNEYTYFKYSHPYHRPFWCCNSNFFTDRFAVGCDGEICVYSVDGIQELRSISENAYSLAYNENGSVLHLGCETGDFVMYDLRSEATSTRINVSRQMLDDVLMLSNENYCIVSGVSGCLSKLDLRMQKVVVEYPHHDRRSQRIPVSVHEGLNLLSATGADDVTRFWSLSSGRFFNSFRPPSTYPARSCFLPDSTSGDMLVIQDNFIHLYSMLT